MADVQQGGNIISIRIGGRHGQPEQRITLESLSFVGAGSFGTVFQARWVETGEIVAIKKVLQDSRYRNRELQLLKIMDHPNVVSLKRWFYSSNDRGELFLNLIMEYVPETMHWIMRNYDQRVPIFFVKLYMYQIFKGLAYIHTVHNVCHRDLKPQNILVDPVTHKVKIGDFGSAKVLVTGETNTSYVCSRYYRAPELIFEATEYTTAIDIWSAGCILAELLLGKPLFLGENPRDQLVEIMKIIGTPTGEELRCMNSRDTGFRYQQMTALPWDMVFETRMPPTDAIDLVSRLLQYSPHLRGTALELCAHPFFNELRQPNVRLPNGRPLPPLFDFGQELRGAPPELINRLNPDH